MKALNRVLNFLNRYYDKVILGVVLLLISFVLLAQIRSLNKTRKEVQDADKDWNKSKKALAPVEISDIESGIDLTQSVLWEEAFGEGSLFDPGKYVFSGDGSPYLLHVSTIKNPYTGAIQPSANSKASSAGSASAKNDSDLDDDSIPDIIEDKYGLNKHDPNDAKLDKDRDGFSNREEFTHKTDIGDPESRPKLINRLRFLKKSRTPLEITLKKVNMNNQPEDKKSWDIMINYKSHNRWKSDFLKIGDLIPEHRYRIIDAEYHEVIRENIPVEQSKIIIEKGDEAPITLHRNRPGFSGEIVYELLYLFTSKPLKITTKLDKEFPLEDLKGQKELYRLVEDQEDELIVESIETEERFEVSRVTSSDKKLYLKK